MPERNRFKAIGLKHLGRAVAFCLDKLTKIAGKKRQRAATVRVQLCTSSGQVSSILYDFAVRKEVISGGVEEIKVWISRLFG